MPQQISTASRSKARVSVSLDIEKKQALEAYAKGKNRSVHFVMLEIIDKALQKAKEQSEYEKWVEKRVLDTLHQFENEGSNGIPSEQVFDVVMSKVKQKLNTIK